jgi:hypothetical protein
MDSKKEFALKAASFVFVGAGMCLNNLAIRTLKQLVLKPLMIW